MKKINMLSLAFASILTSTSILADEGAYVGIKLGQASVDMSGTGYSDLDMSGSSFLLGYDFGADFSLEFEVGSYDDSDYVDVEVDIVALYGAWRLGDKWFFKPKVGLLKEDVKASGPGGFASEDDTGLSLGLGGGYQMDNFIAEIEYTVIEADVSAITLGLSYKF